MVPSLPAASVAEHCTVVVPIGNVCQNSNSQYVHLDLQNKLYHNEDYCYHYLQLEFEMIEAFPSGFVVELSY